MEFGKPGTCSSLALRVAQALATGLTLVLLLLNPQFRLFSLTGGLAWEMIRQMQWSLLMMLYDITCLKQQQGNLLNRRTLAIFTFGDFTMGNLLLGATSSSGVVYVHLKHDSNWCRKIDEFCDMFLVALVFAFFGWLLSVTSTLAMVLHCADAN